MSEVVPAQIDALELLHGTSVAHDSTMRRTVHGGGSRLRRRQFRITAGVMIGIGLGAFADGIVLHQILQWHNMGSSVLPPLSMETMVRNMRWDGFFHLASWAITLTGVWMLWAAAHSGQVPGARAMAGELLVGWGLFNLLEGVVDHHLLGLHHVRDLPRHVPAYDWLFLVISAGVLALGWGLTRSATAPAATAQGRTTP